ncbi:MAG: hypothetical protein R2705_10625 [Ilumatobacteraceae bacterium]
MTRFYDDDIELVMRSLAVLISADPADDEISMRVVDDEFYVRSGPSARLRHRMVRRGRTASPAPGLPADLDPSNEGCGVVQAPTTSMRLRYPPRVGRRAAVAPAASGRRRPARRSGSGVGGDELDGTYEVRLDLHVDDDGNLARSRCTSTTSCAPTPPSRSRGRSPRPTEISAPAHRSWPLRTPDRWRVPTDPETQAAIDVLAELGQRRPDLCSDVELGPDDSPEEFLAAYEQCLRDAGEEAAADAFATLGSIADDRAAAGAGG